MRNLLLSKLLTANFSIFIPIIRNEDFDRIILKSNSYLHNCLIKPATKNSSNCDILDFRIKSSKIQNFCDTVITYNNDCSKIWLIPVDDVYDFSTLLLNDKKDCYLIEEKSLNTDEIKNATLGAIKKLL